MKIIYHLLVISQHIYFIYILLGLYHMKRTEIFGKAYQLFYLADDHTNSVFEKVFICGNDVLKNIRYGFQTILELIGLVGPVHLINSFLISHYCRIEQQEPNSGDYQLKLSGMTTKFNLQEIALNEKPSIYLIKLESKQKQQKQTVFLTLISKSGLYYQKPYDQKSLTYILIRFMADLTNDIILLYDKKMLTQFNEDDCPYASMNSRCVEMKIKETNVSTIDISDVQSDCRDVLELYEKQRKSIDWNHFLVITQNSYLQYFEIFNENQAKISDIQTKKSKQQQIWKRIIQDGLDHDSIGSDEKSENTALYRESVKQLKSLHDRIRKQVQNLAYRCYRCIENILHKQREKIQDHQIYQKIYKEIDKIYFRIILDNEVEPRIQNSKIVMPKLDKVLDFLVQQSVEYLLSFYSDLSDLNERTSDITDEIYKQIQQLWRVSSVEICSNICDKFLTASEYILSVDQSFCKREDKIEITRFELIKVRKNNEITKMEYKKQQKSTLFISQIKKHVPSLELKQIKDIKIFKSKFIRECKVLLVSRQIKKDEQFYEYLLMIVERGEVKLIAKYQQKKLIFTFDEKTRKVYLVKPSEKVLITFVLDQFQKSRNQKQFSLAQSESDFQIISYSISKTPKQRFYYLDSKRSTLYCYDLTDRICLEFHTEQKRLKPFRGKFYENVKAFNHNIYIVLGNSEVIDIYELNIGGQLNNAVRTIECQPNQIFIGMSTYSDQRNQYLSIYGINQFQTLIFKNMGSDNFIEQTKRKQNLGNPIIDIFYEAQDRFGFYTTYTVCKNTPELKKVSLHHIIESPSEKNKIQSYLKLIRIKNHLNPIYFRNEINKIYDTKFLCVNLTQFINQAESRIPVQICSVQYGNVIPLKDGNIVNTFEGQKVSIEKRCQALTFGIVERMLREDTNKRTIVVSVMGAQSTGKSYLLNRIFGTRFTVASCRTTIGIWASIIKTEAINFVVLDCEGLFGLHRELNEEQKLIKILTSVSDFTILNLNKSMTNKSHSQLMINLSKSVNKAEIKSNQLYNGDLVIVVRDVAQIQQQQIIQELDNNYHSNQGIKQFIKVLFNKNIERRSLLIYNFPSYTQSESFSHSAENLKNIFIQKSRNRPIRNSETILDWIKIVINQLACDDIELPEEVMEKRIIQLIQQKAQNAWKKGSESATFKGQIKGIELCIQDSTIEIYSSENCLNYPPIHKFFDIFKQKVVPYVPIDSVTFKQTHNELNQFIIAFFNQRQANTKKILDEHLNGLQKKSQQLSKKIEQKVKSIHSKIKAQKEGLRLCLKQCSPNCEQPCIKIHQHNLKIEQKIGQLITEQQKKESFLENNNLTQQQQKQKQAGIDLLQKQCEQKIQSIRQLLQKFQQKKKLSIQNEQAQSKKFSVQAQIALLTKEIDTNKSCESQFKNLLFSMHQIFELYQQYLKDYVRNAADKFIKQADQIAMEKKFLENFTTNFGNRGYVKEGNVPDIDFQEIDYVITIGKKLLEEKVEIQSLIHETTAQKNVLKTRNACTLIEKQQLAASKNYLQNILNLAILHKSKEQYKALYQKLTINKNEVSAHLTKLTETLNNKIYSEADPSAYIISQVSSLMKKKKEILSVCYKKMVILQEELKQLYLQYEIKDEAADKDKEELLQKKINFKLRLAKSQAKKKLSQNQSLIQLLKQSRTNLQNLTQTYQKQKQKLLQQFNIEQNKQQYGQEINLITYLCDYSLDPDQEYDICNYIGIFGDFYDTRDILTLCWEKIMKYFQEEDREVLERDIGKAEEFYVRMTEFNNVEKEKSITANTEKLHIMLEKQNDFINSISSIGHETEEEDLSQLSLIQSLIKYDQILIKCEKFCKMESIAYFIRVVGYLGRICDRSQDADRRKDNIVKVIVENNPKLSITVSKTIKIQGQFTQTFSQLSKALHTQCLSYQRQLFTLAQIDPKLYLNKLSLQIEQIRSLVDNSLKFELFLGYILQVANHFKDGVKKMMYQYLVIMGCLEEAKQHQGDGKDINDIFLDFLLRACLELCKTLQKLKNNQQIYKQKRTQLQGKLAKVQEEYTDTSNKLSETTQKIHQKQKQNQNLPLSADTKLSYSFPTSSQEQIQKKLRQLLKVKQSKLTEINQLVEKEGKELTQLEYKMFCFEDFARKIGAICEIGVEITVDKFKQEIKTNWQKYARIVRHRNQIQQIQLRLDSISNKLDAIQNQIKQYTNEELKKTLKLEQENKNYLMKLQKKIAEISQINASLLTLQDKIQQLKKSTEMKCSCLTDHRCNRKCEMGCNDENKSCLQKAGHLGYHACNDHQCGKKCQINQKCQTGCTKVYGHTNEEIHSCGTLHLCKQKCNYCRKTCQENEFAQHTQHNCRQSRCPQKCILCGKQCHSISHKHNDQAQIIKVLEDGKQVKKRLHLCESVHYCQNLCTHPGICSKTYQNKDGFWQKNGIDTKYDYIQQIEMKRKCGMKIEIFSHKHEGQCICDINHYCSQRCPDCKSLCSNSYGHSQSTPHKTIHRNQQLLIYAANTQDKVITLTNENEKFIFEVGDQFLPFKCNQSCVRKGRGHYHLIECPGGEQCYEKRFKQGAKHSENVYRPWIEKKYDMLLCHKYWQAHNFQMPIQDPSFRKCNFACTIDQEHKDKKNNFCELQAWHSMSTNRGQHLFSCYHKKLTINSIQICFLLDMSGSMFDYNKKCMDAIQKIIQSSSKTQSNKMTVKFAAVGYRDHLMHQSPLFKKIFKLLSQKKKSLSQQANQNCFAQLMTQATFEDVLLKLQRKYNSVKNQQNFLQRFDQTEQIILKYHFPFVLDVKSGFQFLDQKRRQIKQKYDVLKKQQQSIKNLKQILESQINYFAKQMETQRRQEILNLEKNLLLECQDFTSEEECKRFLERLKEGGGGDPPEALIDGMDAASKLNWQSGDNTIRYIFHLLDAPPHGKIYDPDCEDYYPEGCPCKKDPQGIIEKIMKVKINYFFYPLTQKVTKALSVFKSKGLKYEIKDIKKTQDFIQHASLLVCKQMEQGEILVRK